MTEPTKLQEAVARAIYRQKGIDPDMGTAMVEPELHVMERAWELEIGTAQAVIRATLDELSIYTCSLDEAQKIALDPDGVWQAIVRHIKKRECSD